MRLCRLIYSSYAVPNLNYPDLRDIMEKSEQNNQQIGLTGMLCYGDGMFLQILEGGREAVNRTYQRICNDQRHYNLEIIECVEVEHRLFPVWSMKTVQLGSYYPERVKELLLKYSPSTTFLPQRMSTSQCLHFMLELRTLYQTTS
ncbi:MAG: BLUF domain-containing protein [Pseudanabaenaceae cyanobacterium]